MTIAQNLADILARIAAARKAAFTASTLAAAAVVTGHHRVPWSCWQVCKFAAPLWYGVEAAAKARRRVAERRGERAVAEAAAAAAGVNNKN